MTDSHVHLLDSQFDGDREPALTRARQEGIHTLVEIGLTVESSRRAVEFAESHQGVFAVIGFHPNHASEARPGDVDALLELAGNPKVVAWGEIGMDFFRDYAPREAQEPLFRAQIQAARKADLPLVIHQRAAEEDVLRILEEEGASDQRPVNLHCFGGSADTVRRLAPKNYYFGFGGAFTYARKGQPAPMREALLAVPRERLLLETDAPYLAPLPHRGQRNEPAYIRHTALILSKNLGVSAMELEAQCDRNARTFFHRLPALAAS